MTNVEIEYCVPCGHLNRAVDTQKAILEHFGREIDGVRLKTGHGGIFEIRVNGETIYDKTRPYDLDDITETISQHMTSTHV